MKTDALALCLLLSQNAAPAGNPIAVRMLDLNGDGLRDRLEMAGDGTLAIALNRGQRFFEPIAQELPRVQVSDVLTCDLDRDGHADLYLVSPGPKVALRGDGTGRFTEATAELGLGDEGVGLSAEHEDLDGDGLADVLLHDVGGDVVFWALASGGFEREPAMRPLATPPLAGAALTPPPRVAPAPAAPEDDARDAKRAWGSRTPAGTSQTTAGSGTVAITPLPIVTVPYCAQTIEDASTGNCLQADSSPTLGSLYPLGPELNIQPGTGHVGIGTLSPSHLLTVNGAIRSWGQVHAPYGTSITPSYHFGGGGEDAGFSSPSPNSIAMITNASERVRITSGGDVGIGTLVPTAKLDVNGNAKAVRLDALLVRGVNSGTGAAVYGQTTGGGTGVTGYTQSTTGKAASFQIQSSNNDQDTLSSSTTGTGSAGVFSISNSSSTSAAVAASTTGDGHAVSGIASGDGAGVFGYNWSTGSAARFTNGPATNTDPGVAIDSFGSGNGLNVFTNGTELRGISSVAIGALTYGVFGQSPNIGIVGSTTNPNSIAIFSQGNFMATGGKAFVAPHPNDASKEIHFACLEGNESGTYFRGTARLAGGRAVVEVPEEFRLASEREGLSAQLTAVGRTAALWIESQSLERLVVRGDADVAFHYSVNGVRRGYAEHQAIQPNRLWVPEFRGEPFGAQFPDEVRRMLVENGTLEPDYTPNEATAARLGWKLKEREVRPTLSTPVLPAAPEPPAEAAQERAPEPMPEPAREERDEGSTREPHRP